MKDELTWGEQMHLTRQKHEKKNAKRKRETRESHRDYGNYPSARLIKENV